LVEYTNAKGPKDFCDEYVPNESTIPVQIVEQFIFDPSQLHYEPIIKQRKRRSTYKQKQKFHQPPEHENEYYVFDSSSEYLQQHAQQYEHADLDLNQQLSVPTTPVYSDKHPSFDNENVGTSTTYVENYVGFDLNKSPSEN